jgi:hypothetical protein
MMPISRWVNKITEATENHGVLQREMKEAFGGKFSTAIDSAHGERRIALTRIQAVFSPAGDFRIGGIL